MRIFLTGATGFLGRALLLALRREGHEVVAWVRSEERARALLGAECECLPMTVGDAGLALELGRSDAVVNLAGEPIFARWTARRRRALVASRVELTERLVRSLASAPRRPRVLVSASAVGVFGDRGEEVLSEESAAGAGFLPELCKAWESAALRAEPLGVRVVLVRTGIVLGLDGGALPQMLPPFRFGLGGRLASGRQFMSWIHVEDWVRAVCAALTDERFRGAFNATAPEPATNRAFTQALARVLDKPAPFPVPAFALRALFGGAASLLLESQRALPERLRSLGFVHRFPTLAGALADLLTRSHMRSRTLLAPPADVRSPYLARRAPRYELGSTIDLVAPLAESFRFFSKPENLALLTPRALGFRIVDRSGAPAAGASIDYRIRLGPIPLGWRTRFEVWDAPARFVDVQERGPYRCWWHEHRFTARGAGTRMQDRVLYALPFGPLGRLAHRLFVADQLGDIFAQRALAVRLRFGVGESAALAVGTQA